jgi:hypothetical protein
MNPLTQHVKDSCVAGMQLAAGSRAAIADCQRRRKEAIKHAYLVSVNMEPAGDDYSAEWAEQEAMENPE